VKRFLLSLSLILGLLASASAAAAANAVIKCRVFDVDGKPVKGAYIFFYDSPDTRRAVDLVSPATNRNGFCKKEIPAGMYWAVARLKKEGTFDMGPLMIGDKVSPEPLEIEVSPGETLEVEFRIMNLLDTIRTRTKKRKDLNRITGRIVDENDEPVEGAFVFANRYKQPLTMPNYFSAWTGKDGRFTIYLPNGSFYLGVARDFAPGQTYAATTEIKAGPGGNKEPLVLKAGPKPD